MSFIPYLHFDGTCAEAMAFYAEVFGATDLQIMRYSEAPPDTQQAASSERVMHSQFSLGGATLMASDFPEGMAQPQAAVSVMHVVKDLAAATRLCEKLAAGGAVMMPFGPTFFSRGFGMLKDRFGTHWMISAMPD